MVQIASRHASQGQERVDEVCHLAGVEHNLLEEVLPIGVELIPIGIEEKLREPVHAAKGRPQVVRNRIAERFERPSRPTTTIASGAASSRARNFASAARSLLMRSTAAYVLFLAQARDPGRRELLDGAGVHPTPLGRSQPLPVDVPRKDLPFGVADHVGERVVSLHDPPVQIAHYDADDAGVTEPGKATLRLAERVHRLLGCSSRLALGGMGTSVGDGDGRVVRQGLRHVPVVLVVGYGAGNEATQGDVTDGCASDAQRYCQHAVNAERLKVLDRLGAAPACRRSLTSRTAAVTRVPF